MKKEQQTLKRGFTLIELLVVIAIIGILAALVLAALGNARNKANDARIKADLGQLRTLAEVYYDNKSSSYAGWNTCITTPTDANCGNDGTTFTSVNQLKTDVTSAGGTLTVSTGDASHYCMSTPLKSSATKILCVDNTGAYKEGTTGCTAAATSAAACP
jgi:prepilin-type N-terminal cleavage/methylation domain-containing protein